MLLDFIRPTGGSAQVFGMDAGAESAAIRDRIGVLPEGYGFDDYLTGREYVEWAIETKGADDDPDLLILDEPSTGMDPNGIQHMRSVIRDRADRGTTVFFSSHILSEVEAVCDRVGVMNEGRLVAMDTIEGLREGASGRATITLECAAPPRADGFDDIDGVATVSVEGRARTAQCTDPAAKVDVVRRLDGRAEIVDILAENTSLEELFNQYTGGGRDSDREPGEAETREASA
jgi:ABC-2 type transport system ATP-binding protein